MGALLSARLVNTIITELEFSSNIEYNCFYYSDSTVTLAWIRSDPYSLNTFVSNRVTEIQNLSEPTSWYHTPGEINPSDILSRGALVDQLIKEKSWLNGPSWLSESESIVDMAKPLDKVDEDKISSERLAHSLVALSTVEFNLDMSKY